MALQIEPIRRRQLSKRGGEGRSRIHYLRNGEKERTSASLMKDPV